MINLIARENPKSPVSEAYRTIRTNIQFAGVDKAMKTIVFTSTAQDEGKSTVVANLGIVMAQAGQKVVIMDCDFRNPTQHRLFKLQNKGLSNCIATGKDVLEIVQSSGTPGLDILTSGPVAPNPSEILASNRMKTVIDELKEKYASLHRVAIHSDVKEKGKGQFFLSHLISGSIALGYKDIRIDTHPSNLRMQKVIEKAGFSYQGTIVLPVTDGKRKAYQIIID